MACRFACVPSLPSFARPPFADNGMNQTPGIFFCLLNVSVSLSLQMSVPAGLLVSSWLCPFMALTCQLMPVPNPAYPQKLNTDSLSSKYTGQAGLKSLSSCLNPLTTGITSLCHHTQLPTSLVTTPASATLGTP